MSRMWDWILSRRRWRLAEYEEAKKEFERVIGKSSITITLELPPDLEEFRSEFKNLEEDEEFTRAVKELTERYLKERLSKPT